MRGSLRVGMGVRVSQKRGDFTTTTCRRALIPGANERVSRTHSALRTTLQHLWAVAPEEHNGGFLGVSLGLLRYATPQGRYFGRADTSEPF